MDATEAAPYRALLEEQREALRRQLQDMGLDPDDPKIENLDFDFGFADSAQSTAERNKLLALVERLREGLKDVDLALGKVEKGSYGICERCGRPIGAERLEALPAARLCLEDKQKESS
jgi:RNA polymerase-binding protein DksA